jgi:hypothetical protein
MVVLATIVVLVSLIRRMLPVGSISTLFSLCSKLNVELSDTSQECGNILVSSAQLLFILSVLSFEMDQLPVGLQLNSLVSRDQLLYLGAKLVFLLAELTF